MKTEDLIKAIATDTSAPAMSMGRAWRVSVTAAVAVAAVVFFAMIGPRPDIASAVETVRFLLKPAVAIFLAASAFVALAALARPVAAGSAAIVVLAAAPLLLLAAVVIEMAVVPPGQWSARLVGSNAIVCLTYIPLIGFGPLTVFLLALRHGAPTRPALAGAVAGLLAGGIAATFYAMHCTDDSPLFVATWYTIAVAGLAILGALAAPRIARW
ncbi:MAG: DUF1109 family protein [Hyphomicrobiales bacterium]|jgi:hypothetical protein|nr:DUF1109 family protein [Hyphomicrobiales bacterium]MCO5081777.1 NrsF family protein [Rhizobiaceae bacterium]